ncbi:metal-dependent hydrolase [Blattabacterium cuenoti]|uniref:metal-dependent hydrolase n=1 Tax=Blattabacterium cuenoti TaxID=1653831 RepID=UPI00163BB3FD|nr:metal-dependent hydrolase [Blattabacterium cuenoti]
MKVIYLTHSTCIIQIHEKNLLIDPFLYENSSFDKRSLNTYMDMYSPIHYILITHAHYDHVCDVEFFSKKYPNALIIANYEISNFYSKKGINTYGINYGSFIPFSFGKLKYTWACHSSVFNNGIYGGNPGGFLLHTEEGNLYISGDTSITWEMNLFPIFGKIDLSILPIGGRYTMDIEEAIQASNLLKCERVLGVHYNTFNEIKIHKEKSVKDFMENKKDLILLESWDSITI